MFQPDARRPRGTRVPRGAIGTVIPSGLRETKAQPKTVRRRKSIGSGDTDGVARDIGMRGDGEATGEAGDRDDGGGNGRWRKRFDWGSRPTSPASTGTTARPNTPADALIPGRALEKELAKRVAGMDAADVNKALWLTIGAGVVLLACFAQLALSGYF